MHLAWMLEGVGKKTSLVTHPAASWHWQMRQKLPPLRDMVAEATFPASWCPLWSEAHGIWVYLFHASLLECGVGIWGRSRVKFILCPAGIYHWWPACSRHDPCCYPFLVSLWVPSSLHSVACGNHRAHRLDRTGQKINPPATARF